MTKKIQKESILSVCDKTYHNIKENLPHLEELEIMHNVIPLLQFILSFTTLLSVPCGGLKKSPRTCILCCHISPVQISGVVLTVDIIACTGHFVMVPLNMTYLHCLQHSLFEHLFNLFHQLNPIRKDGYVS